MKTKERYLSNLNQKCKLKKKQKKTARFHYPTMRERLAVGAVGSGVRASEREIEWRAQWARWAVGAGVRGGLLTSAEGLAARALVRCPALESDVPPTRRVAPH